MDKQRFSEENNEEQQRQALQEGHILKDKRASPETEQLSPEWGSLFLLPETSCIMSMECWVFHHRVCCLPF